MKTLSGRLGESEASSHLGVCIGWVLRVTEILAWRGCNVE
jgi:hypothetical protein